MPTIAIFGQVILLIKSNYFAINGKEGDQKGGKRGNYGTFARAATL
jgi:hypothetical protein